LVGGRKYNTGFSACGMYPYDSQKIPNHTIAISDHALDESNSTAAVKGAVNIEEQETLIHNNQPQTAYN
jgi:hypothetical protein